MCERLLRSALDSPNNVRASSVLGSRYPTCHRYRLRHCQSGGAHPFSRKLENECRIDPSRNVGILSAADLKPVGVSRDRRGRKSASSRNSPIRMACLGDRSEEHTSELQSLMRISYAVFCFK